MCKKITIGKCSKFFTFLISLAMMAPPLYAEVSCRVERIKNVQVTASGNILYTSENDVTRLAVLAKKTPAGGPMLQLLLKALDKKQVVQAGFKDGYDCASGDRVTPAQLLILHNAAD